MPDLPQRWLTADSICTLLNINRETLRAWVRKKYLVRIGDAQKTRYLDPGPEYAERLRLGEILHTKTEFKDIGKDISLVNLITAQEFAEIMGWPLKRAKKVLYERKTPGFKKPRYTALYPVSEIRKIVWRYNRRKKASERSPLLLSEIIDFFRRYQAEQDALTPTDSQFEKDDILKKKLEVLMKMPSPQREAAVADFMERMELAKSVTAICSSPSQPNS